MGSEMCIRDSVEAGVGIGKSFAYIVPILYYSKIYHRPVVIATSTIALQEQLTHDIEKIMDMLNYEVEVLIAKGQNHFLCKKRFDDCFTKEFITESEEHQIIYDAICKFGYEKADWNVAIPDEIWNRINVKEYKSQFCKDKCSYCGSCHYHNLRQKMMSTHGIIVCNQDLLAVNMHKKANCRRQLMSEDIGIVVVDEAHNLESKVRSSVTSCISLKQLKDAMYGAGKAVDSFDSEFTKELEKADYLIDEVFKSLLKQMNEQDKEAEKNGQDIDRYYVRVIGTNFDKLRNVLDDIQFKASMSFGDFIGDHSRKNYDEEVEQLEDYVGFLESIIKRKNSEDIFWLERDRGSRGIKGVRLYKCPKEVDKITRRIMFGDSGLPVILTSATITSGKNEVYIKNYTYFNQQAVPEQKSGSIQVLSASLNQDFKLGIFHLDNEVTWQKSSDQTVLPLPDLSLYHNFYMQFKLAKKVLSVQLGADVRYFSKYNAPAYMPAIQNFYLQPENDQVEIGGYPIVNVYANLHLKRTRFYVMMYHVNQGMSSPNYFLSPHYPINPRVLKFGLSWNFYD